MASVEDFFSNIPVVGGFFESDEEKNLKKQYAQMQQKYQAYRPVAQQARMSGLQNVLDPRMLGPLQAQMAKMYGQGAVPDVAPLLRDPLAQGQLQASILGDPARQAAAAKLKQNQAALAALGGPGGIFGSGQGSMLPRGPMPFGNVGGR